MNKTLLLTGLFLLLTSCTQLLFYPMRPHLMTPDALGVMYEDIFLQTNDELELHGWHLHTKGKSKAKILFFHGNGENISTHMIMVAWLTEHGYDVVLVDYRGYGRSQGVPDLEGSILDVDHSIRYVINELLDDDEPFFVMGHSIGGSLSVAALAQNDYQGRVRAFFSISSFSDYRDVAQDALSTSWLTWAFQWPLSFTINNDYSPKKMIADVSPIPLVIIHAENDRIVPVYHADELYRYAKSPKYIHKVSGDHNRILLLTESQDLILQYLAEFVTPGAATTRQ